MSRKQRERAAKKDAAKETTRETIRKEYGAVKEPSTPAVLARVNFLSKRAAEQSARGGHVEWKGKEGAAPEITVVGLK